MPSIHTSVSDIRSSLGCSLANGNLTIWACEHAIRAERQHGNRSSVINLLESFKRKLTRAKQAKRPAANHGVSTT